MSNKETSLKEKLRQALASTVRVISDELEIKKTVEENKKNFIEIDNLNNEIDFIRVRAETDSTALKKKFSNIKIYNKNLPSNSNCKSLYAIAEKARYEKLGGKMLQGVEKNLKDNYSRIINSKKTDRLKTKEDVSVSEAFELYMLKNFYDIKLNSFSSKILDFWEKDFDRSINEHIKFLKDNFENQNIYASRFSEILQKMDIFQTEDNEETKEENSDEGQNNPSNDDQESNTEDRKDENDKDESQASLDSDYDIDEYKLDEQMVDKDSEQESSEQVIQKKKY